MAEPPVPPSGIPPGGPIKNPFQDSGVTPTSPTPEYGRDKPRVGSGEETQEPKPFSLPPEPGKSAPAEASQAERPTPFELAGEINRQKPWSQEQMNAKLSGLQHEFSTAQKRLQNPAETQNFVSDHYEALNRLVDKLNPDMRTIAKYTNQEYTPLKQGKGQGVLNWVVNWLNSSQGTLGNAMESLSKMEKPNPADYLKLQYSVQRATQRGELFASIIGAGVSGIKTLMSTQLG